MFVIFINTSRSHVILSRLIGLVNDVRNLGIRPLRLIYLWYTYFFHINNWVSLTKFDSNGIFTRTYEMYQRLQSDSRNRYSVVSDSCQMAYIRMITASLDSPSQSTFAGVLIRDVYQQFRIWMRSSRGTLADHSFSPDSISQIHQSLTSNIVLHCPFSLGATSSPRIFSSITAFH